MKENVKSFLRNAKQIIIITLVLMFLCGFVFPVLMTGISAIVFPYQAQGSLISVNGKPVASQHVGQQFTEDYYMWSRPSAYNYNVYTEDASGNQFYLDGSEFGGLASGSNNYAASNPALEERVKADIALFLEKNPDIAKEDIPADLLTASGSGLDPHISPKAAEIQIPRIAKASGLSTEKIQEIIKTNTKGKLLGVFGEEIVNVVNVNIEIGNTMGILAK